MSFTKFCQKFAKKNELSSNDARKLSESVQKLLNKNDLPSKSEIKSEVSFILTSKIAKKFSKKLFAKLESRKNQSNNDNDYRKGNTKKKDKNSKKKKDKSKSRKKDDNDDYEREYDYYDNEYDDYNRGYDDYDREYDHYDRNYDDYDIYYYYSESAYASDIDSEKNKKKIKRSSDSNRDHTRDTRYEKDKRGKQTYPAKFRSSTGHVTTSKTMVSPAYTSSEYQRHAKDIEQKRVPLSHRLNERGKAINDNRKNDVSNNASQPDNEAKTAENDEERNSNTTESVRQRFIIYVVGLPVQVNTVSKLYRHFHLYGRILGIQVNRKEAYALIEFIDLKSAYTAVNSKKPVFGNKLIKLGFASNVDSDMLEMFRKKDEEIEKQSKEMKSDLIFIDEDNQSDFSYDQSDGESYDMPDDV